jgi:CBS domain-containing protein
MYKPTFVDPETRVDEVARLMVERDLGCVIVGTPKKPLGIFSDKDVLRRVTMARLDQRNTRIHEVMSSPLITIDESATLEDAYDLMQENRIRRLPVTDGDGAVVGLVGAKGLVQGMSFESVKKSYLTTSRINHLLSRVIF